MRTSLTQQQISAIVEGYFHNQGSAVNFVYHCLDENGYSGCLVDHDYEVELPVDTGDGIPEPGLEASDSRPGAATESPEQASPAPS